MAKGLGALNVDSNIEYKPYSRDHQKGSEFLGNRFPIEMQTPFHWDQYCARLSREGFPKLGFFF